MGVIDAVWLATVGAAGVAVGLAAGLYVASRRTPPQNEVVGCCADTPTVRTGGTSPALSGPSGNPPTWNSTYGQTFSDLDGGDA